MEKNIVILPGDGIGKEVMDAAVKVLEEVAKKYNHSFITQSNQYGPTGCLSI